MRCTLAVYCVVANYYTTTYTHKHTLAQTLICTHSSPHALASYSNAHVNTHSHTITNERIRTHVQNAAVPICKYIRHTSMHTCLCVICARFRDDALIARPPHVLDNELNAMRVAIGRASEWTTRACAHTHTRRRHIANRVRYKSVCVCVFVFQPMLCTINI